MSRSICERCSDRASNFRIKSILRLEYDRAWCILFTCMFFAQRACVARLESMVKHVFFFAAYIYLFLLYFILSNKKEHMQAP